MEINNNNKLNKDWTGNSKTTYSILGASNHTDKERIENDYYATPSIATEKLLEYFPQLPLNTHILEPACGEGHISKVLIKNGYHVTSSDLIDRGYGMGNIDFLNENYIPKINNNNDFNIITNPPYKYAQEFVEKSLSLVKEDNYVIMFLKLTFLEGKKRYELFKENPPKYIYVFSSRVECGTNGVFSNNGYGGAVCYAWFIWQKGNKNKPVIDWIM